MIEPMTMFPVLVAEDLAALKAFYESSFGFRTVFFETDFYLHLVHPNSGVQLGFLVPDHPPQPEFLHPKASAEGMVISFEVADIDAALTSARSMGLDFAMNHKEEPWGQKHFMVRDPAGFIVDVIEHQNP